MADLRVSILDSLRRDIRYAIRALRRSPGFCVGAILILGLGIGANTTMFSAVNTILLQPLGYAKADELVVILHNGRNPVAPANFLDWRRDARSFARMGAAEAWGPNLGGAESAERVRGLHLTADVLPLLGVPPVLGRLFGKEDEVAGRDHRLVIGYGLWQRQFSGDPRVIGRTVMLDGEPYDIIGVMPRGFAFAPFWVVDAEVFAPLPLADRQTSRDGKSLRVFARLAPDVSAAQAQAEITTIAARLERAFPGSNRDVTVTALKERVVGNARLALLVLLVAVGFVLLIACANVAHLLLARATARQREVAVRMALGATRTDVIRQSLVESLVLASLAGAAGLLLAVWGIHALAGAAPGDLPRVEELAIDRRVLAFTLGVSLLTGLLFGLMPALQATAVGIGDTLKAGGRGASGSGSGGGSGRGRMRDALIVSEFALAIVLLVGAGLMIRSFAALQAIDPGFHPDHVLAMNVSVKGAPEAEPARRAAFYREVVDRLRALPGVDAASAINHLPVGGDVWGLSFYVAGRPVPKPGEQAGAAYRVVLPNYFRTMRLPLVRGRDITAQDTLDTPPIVVINEYLANKYWPGEDPIGKRITLDDVATSAQPAWLTVAGVVKNAVQHDWSAELSEEVYLPYLQTRDYLERPSGAFTYLTIVMRTTGDPAAMAASARAAVSSVSPAAAISEVDTMDAVVTRAMARPRFQLAVLAAFAGVALLLAAAGIYGVMSYAISRRTQEIGLRLTLGAQRGDVLKMVLGQAMTLVGLGTIAGLAGALVLTRLMSSLLYGVRPTDPLTFGTVSLVLVGTALLASFVPAHRATRIDPMRALRQD
jgi:putative ABC transport system permease protein